MPLDCDGCPSDVAQRRVLTDDVESELGGQVIIPGDDDLNQEAARVGLLGAVD